ncbi:MaoC family dehydratase [Advenella sp. FME57]|uniref:MaoC family dehydratase n=1 Tax=Advenella sp. FME57 TaxID=2742604 RepID=UPI001866602F|nr:MaoC family dehydratase [Advenella sp. FME57]
MTTAPSSACAIQKFDCVAALDRFVGQPAIASAPLLIEQEMINRFAHVTHDHQWIHVDPERAKTQSPSQHTIAHGFLVLSLLTYWQTSCMAFPGAVMALNYGFDKIRFTAPVVAGSRVSASFALTQVTETKPAHARCTWEVTVNAENAPRPSVYAEWHILVQYEGGEAT